MQLRPEDRVLFYGDSITEQHLWTLYLENLLLWHEPSLIIRNRGWAANRAADGLARFDRDAAPLAPTWLFVAFGMNDGQYQPPSPALAAAYEAALTGLVRRGRASGAGVVLCSPPAVDEARDPVLAGYNETLALLTDRCRHVAEREGARFVDLFHPTLAAGPGLSPDGIHPAARGHLIMARAAARQLGLGDRIGLLEDGTPDPSLDWRRAAPLAPGRWSVYVDGERAGNYTADELSRGVSLRGGGLRARARAVMALSQALWQVERAAWRTCGPLGWDEARNPAGAAALQAVAAELEGRRRRLLTQPFAVAVHPEIPVALGPWEVSGPYFPDAPEALMTRRFPPEPAGQAPEPVGDAPEPTGKAPDAVEGSNAVPGEFLPWKVAETAGPQGFVDLQPLCGPVNRAVAYARCTFTAPGAGELILHLGSDDGYRLWLNGQQVAEVPVFRGSAPGQEVYRLPVAQGENRLLLRIHQGIGDWNFYATAYLRTNGGSSCTTDR